MRQRFNIGRRVVMADDAVDNYGGQYRDRVFVVEHVATKRMLASEFFAKNMPQGYHPGFNDGNSALYDLKFESGAPFNNSLYDWELEPAPEK